MNILAWLLLLLIPLILLAFTRRGSARRYNIKVVASLFLKNKACSPETAKSPQELGIKPPSTNGNPFINMLFGGLLPGDNGKQDALNDMIRDHIVIILPDGRLYLSEAKYKSSRF